jgi:hypothetical protein
MQVGIIGLPLSGKTTVYNALTGSHAETAAFSSGQVNVRTAIVRVPDPRVDLLSRMFQPKKTTYAQMQFNDISGIAKGSSSGKGFDPQVLNAISKCDALLLVVRGFANPLLQPADADPSGDLATLRIELILSDLAIVERRTERIDAGYKKARVEERPALDLERALMERFREALEGEQLISDLELTEEEAFAIRGFQFLSAKPSLVVYNLPEDAAEPDLAWANHRRNSAALALKGALEMEIAQLGDEDKALFQLEYDIAEPSLPRLVRESYDLLGLMSFFTVGEDEVRAWTVRRSATAVEAAGAIHSDLARGFIRAEIISYDNMIAQRTMANARKEGKLRLEGRDYVVQNGEILNIRFNV